MDMVQTENITLQVADGTSMNAYVATPADGAKLPGLLVFQEAFGVNQHIRSVADGYAKDGFLVIAPALFDRVEKHVDLTYEGEDRNKALSFMPMIKMEDALKDMAAALNYGHSESGKKAGTIGYCWGGTLSWLSATRLDPDAAVGYYGGGIGSFAAETPTAPVMLHFGKLDSHIPKEDIDRLQAAHPAVEIFWYDAAGHGFNCDLRSSYEPASAKLARERSLSFLMKNLAS